MSDGRKDSTKAQPHAKPPKPRLPAPVKPVNTGFTHLALEAPQDTEIPPDFPLYYPNELKVQTRVILSAARQEFPKRTQIVELCKYVISELTPLFCKAVKDGMQKAHLALSDMGELLRLLLVHNSKHGGERYELEQELRRSDERREFEKAIAEAERLRADANQMQNRRTQNRDRSPDYEKSRQRVSLEDQLRSELGTIKSRAEKFATVEALKNEFSDFQLWKILSPIEQEELLTEEFKPHTYARTLVMRQFGLTNPETIKKDRQKLRKGQ